MEKKNNKSFGVASLTCGIIGNMFVFMPYLGLPLSILAIVFASKQKERNENGMATAGNVLGIIGVVINSIMLLFLLVVFFALVGVSNI